MVTRTACLPTAAGCARCQFARRPLAEAEMLLLLGAHNDHAHEATLRALTVSGLQFQHFGNVLAVPAARHEIHNLQQSLDMHLSSFVQDSVRAVFFHGNIACTESALSAFVDAEPLPALLARFEHEWVRDALDEGWLFSEFHPIVTAETQDIHGYEALIRARHPKTQATIGAWPIIQACEALQLEHVLDQRARQTAIRDAAALQIPDGKFFINFLPNTIYDPEICLRTTMNAANEHGMDLSRLVFEVVETENIPDMKRLHHILDYYKSRGVGTAVDDMGAGYSSLDYLSALRPDYVKLDRALVVDAEHSTEARRKMDDIIALAKKLGTLVIAEGIETPSQMHLCQEAGADFMQGFLFARPANPPQTVRRFESGLMLAA